MTADERRRLRREVSARKKELHDSDAKVLGQCAGCGCLLNQLTVDCHQCKERWKRKYTWQEQQLRSEIAHVRVLLDEQTRKAEYWKGRALQRRLEIEIDAPLLFVSRYETEEERREARRRSWRMASRRRRAKMADQEAAA